MSYFGLLPSELLFELFLHFNYRDTILYCQALSIDICQKPFLWLYKIRKELGYSNEFIHEYVYDNGVMKTLLPINEKYLELKARKGVDFGCEFYKGYPRLIVRSSRLNDFKLADELTHYLLNISKVSSDTLFQRKVYQIAIRGAIGNNNIVLADKLIDEYYHQSNYDTYQPKQPIINNFFA